MPAGREPWSPAHWAAQSTPVVVVKMDASGRAEMLHAGISRACRAVCARASPEFP
eukprot:CAMPEP_0175321334 /NCGR_PEP_ID=MMETSP0093-20121207/71902_1 /TAXON_ID=311494 /ORGANISM="Alexandrium monilatum, Strain CCMP3105" /LENGTH=54 /DNA_ID=CAMNT_0016618181 /DNA_START=81 /DNA_END=242 /DNA_ORIENTATION=-